MTRPSITSGGDLQGFIGTRPEFFGGSEVAIIQERHEGRAVTQHSIRDLPGACQRVNPSASHHSSGTGIQISSPTSETVG